MTQAELSKLIQGGESSHVQFKEHFSDDLKMAHEMIAFSNTKGGLIIIGINDKSGEITGIAYDEIQETNKRAVNVASQFIFPPIRIETETVEVKQKQLVVLTIEEGLEKPYKDRNGIAYLKNGSDKRKVTSNEEFSRLLESGGYLHPDERVIEDSSIGDLDKDSFDTFLFNRNKVSKEDLELPTEKFLNNLKLAQGRNFRLAGLLCLSTKRQYYCPMFTAQCLKVNGTDMYTTNTYDDSEVPIDGTIRIVFKKVMDFIDRAIRKVPSGPGFNAVPTWEIPREVFEELVANAFFHRDYLIESSIKIIIFDDRIEIINPGILPNSLDVDNIKSGVAVPRNPVLVSVARYLLPYHGYGTGIIRACNMYPFIDFQNDRRNYQFKAIIKRP
jgi:predicted HTH transcriptional regulator